MIDIVETGLGPIGDVVLHTERLLLRPMVAEDAQALFEIHSQPETHRYGSTPPWSSINDAHEKIARHIEAHSLGYYLQLGVVLADSQRLIGDCCLYAFDAQCRRAEIGYGIAPAYWGNGYMTEALLALVMHGFKAIRLRRIEADIHPDNHASARVLERLGFLKEGFLRERWQVGDEISDSVIYGLLRSDWSDRLSD